MSAVMAKVVRDQIVSVVLSCLLPHVGYVLSAQFNLRLKNRSGFKDFNRALETLGAF